jgi:head-tail adaptor
MSRFSDVVNLTSITEGTDAEGFPANVEVTRNNIFANKMPVHSAEFYQASQAGFTIQSLFQIRSIDYEGEESLTHNNEPYEVVRTYDKGEFVELSCERRDADYG